MRWCETSISLHHCEVGLQTMICKQSWLALIIVCSIYASWQTMAKVNQERQKEGIKCEVGLKRYKCGRHACSSKLIYANLTSKLNQHFGRSPTWSSSEFVWKPLWTKMPTIFSCWRAILYVQIFNFTPRWMSSSFHDCETFGSSWA